MKARQRVLMVSIDIPCEVGTGSIVRSWHFLRELALTADLDLLLLQNAAETCVAELQHLGCRVIASPCETSPSDATTLRLPASNRVRLVRTAAAALFFPFRDWMLPLKQNAAQFECALKSSGNRLWTRMFLRICLSILNVELWVGEQLGFAAPAICSDNYDGFLQTLRILKQDVGLGIDYDCIWFEHTVSFPFAELLRQYFPRAMLICNSHNIEHRLASRLSTGDDAGAVSRSSRQRIRGLRLVETAAIEASRITLVCSEEDRRDALNLCPAACVRVAPNGVDLLRFRISDTNPEAERRTLIFTGGMNYKPNLDGVLFFLQSVFPIILRHAPDTRLIIAGRRAKAELPEWVLHTDGIDVISDPLDMRPVFGRATVAVVPLLSGGGTRLKILEAMAMQIPVVSTTIGAEGVPYENGQHLLIADEPSEFAEAVLLLLNDASLRIKISHAGRDFVESGYGWSMITSVAVQDVRAAIQSSHRDLERHEDV